MNSQNYTHAGASFHNLALGPKSPFGSPGCNAESNLSQNDNQQPVGSGLYTVQHINKRPDYLHI